MGSEMCIRDRSISAQNLLAQTLQLTLIDGKSAKDAVSEGMEIMTEAIE